MTRAEMDGGRLLAVSAFPPWPIINGYAVRVANLIDRLVDTWRITLVSPSSDGSVSWPTADRLKRWVRVPATTRGGQLARRPEAQAPMRTAIEQVLQESRFDAALLWGGTEFLAADGPELPPVVWECIDCRTLQELRYLLTARRPLSWLRHLRAAGQWARHERRILKKVREATVVGRDDATMLRRLAPGRAGRVHVLPNGVLLHPFADYSLAAVEPTIAFTGHLSYPPNVNAARHLVERVWPMVRARVPEARCVIAGRSPRPEILSLARRPGVRIEPDVPRMEDVLARAWVVVAPMREGSGIKNKVLEAWAVGRPVVMYPLATDGLRMSSSLQDLIVKDPASMADRVARLLGDRGELETYASAVHENAREHGWDRAVMGLNALIEQSMKSTAGRT